MGLSVSVRSATRVQLVTRMLMTVSRFPVRMEELVV